MYVELLFFALIGFFVFLASFFISRVSFYNERINQLEMEKNYIKNQSLLDYQTKKRISDFYNKMNAYRNKKVIIIPSKRTNPIVGVCTHYEINNKEESITIKDYITDKNVVLSKAKIFLYNKEILNTLYKLNPEERFYLSRSIEDPNYFSEDIILNKYEIIEKLETNLFHEMN